MEKIIHTPEDIVVGKLYKSVSPRFKNNTIYLGGYNNDTHEKFLIIVVYDHNPEYYVGKTVVKPDNTQSSLWILGFEEQDTQH